MDDVRGDFLGPPHGTIPAVVIANKNKKVQVGKGQEKAQSVKDSHSKNQGRKKTN